jgi:molecular chaperone DnaJ
LGNFVRVEDYTSFGSPKKTKCNSCNGTGQVILENCHICHGSRIEQIEDIIDINIPAGSRAGMQIIVSGKGHEDGGLEPGDLIVFIKELENDGFIRNGTNLRVIKEISVIDAILGCKIKVKLPLGEMIQTVVEPGTQHGTVLQFPGKGIPELNMGMKGDFLVEIHIMIPTPKDEEDLALLEILKTNKLFNNE